MNSIRAVLIAAVLFFPLMKVSGQCPVDAIGLANGGTFNGTCPIDMGGGITITGPVIWTSGTLTLNNGNLIVGTGGSIDIQGGTVTMGNGVLTVNSGSNVTIGAGSQLNGSNANDVIVSGTMDVYGTLQTYNANGGDVEVIGGYITVYNMGHIECSDDFQVTSGGTLEVQVGGTVYFNDNMRNSVEGGASSQGTFIINGTVTGGDGNDDGSQIDIGDTTPDSSFGGSGTVITEQEIEDNEGGPYDGCTMNCVALPVEFTSFTASNQGDNSVLLIWETASEINNSGFYLEKGSDGVAFDEIGFVAGFGTTSEVQHYQFVDQNFLKSSYFRLRQVDYDGEFEYSKIIYASTNSFQKFSIFPNPTANTVQLNIPSDELFDIYLIDISGAVIINSKELNVDQIQVLINQEIPFISNGVYYLKLKGQLQSFESRLKISR